MANRVTIKSIALELGVSHMTVSRALSNNPNVHPKTRDAVLKRAAELGYVKSAAATAMRGDSTCIVGLLLPNLANEFYAVFANALALLCADRGLHLMIHLTNDDAARERLAILRLREVQASAVIMVPAPGEPEAEPLEMNDMQVIHLIRTHDVQSPSAALLVEDGRSIGDAVGHLAKAGHMDIGFIGGHKALSSGRHRLRAFRDALRRNRLPPNPALIRQGPPTFDMGQAMGLSLLDGKAPVTALVCGGFEISNGALEACLTRGLKLPGDLAFIGYGDPSFYKWIQGGISTISLPVEDLAFQAAELLSQSARKKAAGIISFPSSLVIRSSA